MKGSPKWLTALAARRAPARVGRTLLVLLAIALADALTGGDLLEKVAPDLVPTLFGSSW